MATPSASLTTNIEHDLTHEIDKAIDFWKGILPASEPRTSAIKTLQYIRRIWSTESHSIDKKPRPSDEIIDKIHIGYTTAQFLQRSQGQPDGLPDNIVACLTKHIKDDRQVLVGKLFEILSSIEKVEMAQNSMVESEYAATWGNLGTAKPSEQNAQTAAFAERGAEGSGKKRKQSSESEVEGGASLPAQKKRRSTGLWATARPSFWSDQSETSNGEDAKSTTTSSPGPSKKKQKKPQSSPSKSGLVSRSGNYEHGKYVPWYPDESKYIKDLYDNHPKMTWALRAKAVTDKFAGTYYRDENGKQYPEQRKFRTVEAVRQHIRTLKKKEEEGEGSTSRSAKADEGSSKKTKATAGKAKASASTKSTANETASDETEDGDETPQPVAPARTNTSTATGPDAPVVIYVAGVGPSGPVEDKSVEDASVEDASVEDASVEDASVEDAPVEDVPVENQPNEDEPENDENPLRDLEEMETEHNAGNL